MKNLVLIGFMGSGKSAVGRIVAGELNLRFVDMDRWIEEDVGCSISEIFSKKGEAFFREIESHAVEEIGAQEGQVISTGGGVILKKSNIDRLREKGVLICLHVDVATAIARTHSHSHRPLLDGNSPERIRALLMERQPLYDSIPNGVETTGRSAHEVARSVIRIYRQHQPPP